MKTRYLEPAIREDVKEKMVFLGGPRQVGKTTLARSIASLYTPSTYLNWDSRPHRKAIMNTQWSPDTAMLVFDELHKYRRWKTLIKGIWDTRSSGQKIMVTGSSRLDSDTTKMNIHAMARRITDKVRPPIAPRMQQRMDRTRHAASHRIVAS